MMNMKWFVFSFFVLSLVLSGCSQPPIQTPTGRLMDQPRNETGSSSVQGTSALTNTDLGECDGQTGFMKSFCVMTVARNTKDVKPCETLQVNDKNYSMCFVNVGVVQGTIAPCFRIQDSMQRDGCIMGVAEELKKPSLCGAIVDSDIKSRCSKT